ncbi:MAG: hypothetical protein ABW318_04350 [Vicinamibacterales bacterium]
MVLKMSVGLKLDDRRGLPWLLLARNEIQTLMLRLWQQWENINPPDKRKAALDAAFSLWRAAFLLVKPEKEPIDAVDDAAKKFLEKVIRTNAIGFSDDLNSRAWSSGYYVENAIYRIKELNPSWDFAGYAYSPRSKVREAWNEAFKELNAFVTGTTSGTTTDNPNPPPTAQSA